MGKLLAYCNFHSDLSAVDSYSWNSVSRYVSKSECSSQYEVRMEREIYETVTYYHSVKPRDLSSNENSKIEPQKLIYRTEDGKIKRARFPRSCSRLRSHGNGKSQNSQNFALRIAISILSLISIAVRIFSALNGLLQCKIASNV